MAKALWRSPPDTCWAALRVCRSLSTLIMAKNSGKAADAKKGGKGAAKTDDSADKSKVGQVNDLAPILADIHPAHSARVEKVP